MVRYHVSVVAKDGRSATGNPAIGISVGIVARAAAREGIQYVNRERQQNEHEAIIAAGGSLAVGDSAAWAVDHRLTGDARGEVRVLRVINTPLAVCKELAFTVENGEEERRAEVWFTTVACHDGATWKWAAAEPAVERWGNLQ